MHETLFAYIENKSSLKLGNGDVELLRKIFVPRKLRKKQYFLQEGEVCSHGGFIVKGAMRQYSVDEAGREFIAHLMLENWWVGDRESMAYRTPSCYFIDAWEECDILMIATRNYPAMLSVPAAAKMVEVMNEQNLAALHRRIHNSISLSAMQRKEELTKNYPEFLERFPQHIIASYLGVAKETFSRIKKQGLRNDAFRPVNGGLSS